MIHTSTNLETLARSILFRFILTKIDRTIKKNKNLFISFEQFMPTINDNPVFTLTEGKLVTTKFPVSEEIFQEKTDDENNVGFEKLPEEKNPLGIFIVRLRQTICEFFDKNRVRFFILFKFEDRFVVSFKEFHWKNCSNHVLGDFHRFLRFCDVETIWSTGFSDSRKRFSRKFWSEIFSTKFIEKTFLLFLFVQVLRFSCWFFSRFLWFSGRNSF